MGTRREHEGNTREHEGTQGNRHEGTRWEHGGNTGTRGNTGEHAQSRLSSATNPLPLATVPSVRIERRRDPAPVNPGGGIKLRARTRNAPASACFLRKQIFRGGSCRTVMRPTRVSCPHPCRFTFPYSSCKPIPAGVARLFVDSLCSPHVPHARGNYSPTRRHTSALPRAAPRRSIGFCLEVILRWACRVVVAKRSKRR